MTLRSRLGMQRQRMGKNRRNIAWGFAELLEERLLLTYDPTSTEQLFLYDTNRTRVDPQGELNYLFTSTNPLTSPDANVNAAMSYFNVDRTTFLSQWSALVATNPLAWNDNLYNAAVGHNAALIASDSQSHQAPGEKDLAGRLTDAGYAYSAAAENVYSYAYSEFYGHSGFLIDWGNATPGHRTNIMNSSYKEVGISVTPENNPATTVGPLVVTEDFGVRSGDTNPRLVGVVYNDVDADGRYDASEGLGNVNITVTGPNGTFTTTTLSAGGWQIQVPAGTYKVAVSGGSYSGPTELTVTVSSGNKEVDFLSGVRGGYVNFSRFLPPTEGIGVFRSAQFYIDSNVNRIWNGNGSGDTYFRFGNTTDTQLVGDWDGDGYDETGIFRNGEWYLDKNNDGTWNAGDQYYNFGMAGDKPVVGDWNGNGIDKIGVVRNGVWYLDTNGNGVWNGPSGGDTIAYFGLSTDTPIIGDWNRDRIDDIGVVRSASWYLDANGNRSWDGTDTYFNFGNASDLPVVGDWNNDGRDEIGVLRAGWWYLDQNNNHAWDGADALVNFGMTGDLPLVGRWKATVGTSAAAGIQIFAIDSGASSSSAATGITANQLAPLHAPLGSEIERTDSESFIPNGNRNVISSAPATEQNGDLLLLDRLFGENLLEPALS